MAVEARHQNLFPQQIIHNNSEFVKIDQTNAVNQEYNNYMQMNCARHFTAATMENPWLAMNYKFMGLNNNMIFQPQTSMKGDSGLTSNLAAAPRKRSRDSTETQLNNLNYFPQNTNSFGLQLSQNLSAQMQQQYLETDYIISEYTKRMKMEMVERQKQDAKWLFARMRGPLLKKLKEKDEEIASIAKLNSALEEKAKNLYIENQIWKDVAQSSEATAQILRNNLDNILAHISINRFPTGGAAVDQETESCCESNDLIINKETRQGRTLAFHSDMAGEVDGEVRRIEDCEVDVRKRTLGGTAELGGRTRMCKKCGERESCVLLLPCRHLCLCNVCGTTLQTTCPVCNSLMNATVHVSMV